MRKFLSLFLGISTLLLGASAFADRHMKSPKEQFGFSLGDDYMLANYKQLTAYWTHIAKSSGRMKLFEIGKTEKGRTMLMAVISSPKNIRSLNEYKEIAEKLAHAEIPEVEARKLSERGKAIVWIDGGLHANEVLGAQQLMETVYQLVTGDDAETKRILDDDIVLAVLANPDGMDLVADWYMRSAEPTKRTLSSLPRLYQKYIGHDNNRDFFASTQSETKAMNHIMYQEWFPQIVYNHHQTGPAGTVLFMPPFRDPFNYRFDPLILAGIDTVGAAMSTRFLEENKGGATSRSGSPYSTWWNGGLRTTCYFHNMIGLLTETIGSPTPMSIPFIAAKQLPKGDLISPIAPQVWHFRQSIDYSVTANKAVLDIASKHRQQFLFNLWRMGRNSIERGDKDSWTSSPHLLQTVSSSGSSAAMQKLFALDLRDPRAYILSVDQVDFATACKFVQTLLDNGIKVERLTNEVVIGHKRYAEGSVVIKCAQAFRPHILDMFEPQDHPDDFAYPGGPPVPPYDIAGWTLAFQMGIKFDRILEPFEAPTELVRGSISPPAIAFSSSPVGYYFSPEVNNSYLVVNRLLASGIKVYLLQEGNHKGQFVTTGGASASAKLVEFSKTLGVRFDPAITIAGKALELSTPKVGLWDRYGGSIESGWTRFVLEKFEFPFEVVYPPQLDAGNLSSKYSALVFPNGAINLGRGRGPVGADEPSQEPISPIPTGEDDLPVEYRGRRGTVTAARTLPQLKSFIESGGSIVTVGSSWNLATALGIPIKDALVDESTGRRLTRDKFYIPGSILQAAVDNSAEVAYGMSKTVNVFFDNSPSFRLGPDAIARGAHKVAWYDSETPLKSGWAWGQKVLKDTVAAFTTPVGKGTLTVFGPEITFRAQPHGTFRLLFNSLLLSNAKAVDLK